MTLPTPDPSQRSGVPGVFLTLNMPVSPEYALHSTLAALDRALRMAIRRSAPHRDGYITVNPDLVLAQLLGQTDSARGALATVQIDSDTRRLIADARVRLDKLASWITHAMIERSGGSASEPLRVPDAPIRIAGELAELGHLLSTLPHILAATVPADSRTDEPAREVHRPLPDRDRILLEMLFELPAMKGMTGKEILAEYPRRQIHGVDQSQLTGRIIRRLRNDGWDIPNPRGGVGYYLSPRDRQRFKSLLEPGGE